MIKTFLFLCLLLGSMAVGGYPQEKAPGYISLDDCIKLATENNPNLAIHRSRIKQKEEAHSIAKTTGLADVSLAASYNRLAYVPQIKQRFLGNSFDDFQARIGLKQPLYAGGRYNAAENEALYSLNTARKAYEGAENELAYRVKTSYFRLMFTMEASAIKEDLSDRLKSYLSVAEELNKRTKLPREETLLRIRAQVSNARQELISAENNVSVTRSLLFNVIGINDDKQYKVMPVEAHSEKVLSKENVYPGLKNNIELLKLEEEIKKAKESSKIARSINYPQINLLASYGYEWSQFPPQQDDWVAGITLDMPLWDWHRTKSRIKQAQAYVEETENTKNSSEKQLLYELESAYLNYTANIERAKIAKEGLQYAQKSLSLFEKRYKDATAASIELLDAGQAYLQARLNYIQAELDIRLAKAEIERITGQRQ